MDCTLRARMRFRRQTGRFSWPPAGRHLRWDGLISRTNEEEFHYAQGRQVLASVDGLRLFRPRSGCALTCTGASPIGFEAYFGAGSPEPRPAHVSFPDCQWHCSSGALRIDLGTCSNDRIGVMLGSDSSLDRGCGWWSCRYHPR